MTTLHAQLVAMQDDINHCSVTIDTPRSLVELLGNYQRLLTKCLQLVAAVELTIGFCVDSRETQEDWAQHPVR